MSQPQGKIEKEVLLDTNYLVGLLQGKLDVKDKQFLQQLKTLRQHIANDEVEIVTTPLTRYEFLRYFEWESKEDEVAKFQAVLSQFTMLDISQEVSDLAMNLYRLDKHKSVPEKNIDKRQFDIFHFATAKVNGIQLLSNDKHLPQLEKLYEEYQQLTNLNMSDDHN